MQCDPTTGKCFWVLQTVQSWKDWHHIWDILLILKMVKDIRNSMLTEPAAWASCSVPYELCFSGLLFFLCRVLSFALVSVLTYLYTDLSTSPADSRTTMPVVPVGWERNLESHSTFQKYAWTRAEMLWTNDRGRVKEELVLIPMFDTIYVTQRGNSALLSWSRSCNENKGGNFFCFAASKTYSFAAMMLLLFLFNSIKMDQVQMLPNYGKINKQEKELVCWGRSCPDQVL